MLSRICILISFFFSFHLQAQVDTLFIKHLSEHNLQREHLSYLQSANIQNDTLAYFLAKYHFQYSNDSLFIAHLKKSRSLLKQDTSLILHYSKHFLGVKESPIWFDSIIDSSFLLNKRIKELNLAYQMVNCPSKEYDVPQQLQQDFSLYLKAKKKKPILAGLMSAIIPGTGLLYLNKPRAFASNLAIVGGFAYQTYEASRIFGWKHPLTIINAAFFSGFYVVNIAGSIMEVKKNINERKKQFLIHANSYYNSTYPTSLY